MLRAKLELETKAPRPVARSILGQAARPALSLLAAEVKTTNLKVESFPISASNQLSCLEEQL